MNERNLMLDIQKKLSANIHYTRRGGYQPLINHYTAVHSGFKRITADDGLCSPLWEAAAFLHDAVEDGILKPDDKRISPELREILMILTPMTNESPQAHFLRQMESEHPQIAAIVYANCMHNSSYTEMEKHFSEDVEKDPWDVARARYLKRASIALARYAALAFKETAVT